ncbi:ChaB family protein [Caenispirillum salinarum]|uniref:ChaB family protein n=1 Tax=Caenispirillum salinarum TaxID=859058 RepID=UPI00385028EE
MTYTSPTELPADVRDALPELGQELYMTAFNEAEGRGDADAARAAWREVEKRYQRTPDGRWEMRGERGNPGAGGGVRGPLEESQPRGIKRREHTGSSAEEPSPLDQRVSQPSTDKPEGNKT